MNVNVVKGMFHWYKTLSRPKEVVGGARHCLSLAWFLLLTRLNRNSDISTIYVDYSNHKNTGLIIVAPRTDLMVAPSPPRLPVWPQILCDVTKTDWLKVHKSDKYAGRLPWFDP